MGPLSGLKLVELWCIGPGPFAGMLLSDMGAEVIRVDRPVEPDYGYPDPKYRTLWRNRRAVTIDLDTAEGVDAMKRLVAQADGFIEGNRPGVCEKIGIGPDDLLAVNPKLVYGRMTGFGQDGPLADKAGFDLSFISLTGVANSVGTADQPVPPLILGGDFGGGGTYLAMGMLAGIIEAQRTGQGQVVDAAMVDGSANLMAYMYGGLESGVWRNERASNNVDGGHWLYRMYRCSDDKFISVACLSPKLYRDLAEGFELDPEVFDFKASRSRWPELGERLAATVASRSRDDWMAVFGDRDACVQPVLDMEEAPNHPHLVARGTFVEHDGVTQPAPAPRFSRTENEIVAPPPANGADTDEVLADWGFDPAEIAAMREAGTVGNCA
ncbi:MAG: CaiB/BaiF CoA-transferase family protein [Actinomycetota bacterium]|nr:CaiB/BaiF CoA-transferase family protein [Actinomycetota bacterium]